MALVGVTSHKHIPIQVDPTREVKTNGALVSLVVPELWTGEAAWIWSIGTRHEILMFSPPKPVTNVHVVVDIKSEKLESGDQRLKEIFSKDLDCMPSQEMLTMLSPGKSELENYRSIRTINFKGMRVAVLEYQDDKKREIEYRMDVRGTGLNLQSLTYVAPIEDFERYYSTAFEVFESSEWRSEFQPLDDVKILT